MFKLSQSCAIVLSYSFQYIFYCMVCCWWNCVIYFPTIRKQNMWNYMIWFLRDRPFNLQLGGLWFFASFRIFFSDNTRVRIFIFFVAQSVIFFSESNIRIYDKNSESDYFFSSTNIRIFFSATLGIRIFKKN